MPRSNYNQRGIATGERRCPQCGDIWPDTSEFFYTRGNGRRELCHGPATRDCRTAYFRNYAATRTARNNRTLASAAATGRRFGVELEFIGSASAVNQAMRNVGLDCEQQSYNHRVPRAWKIVPDGSVSGGAELVSPPLSGQDGREQVRKACAALAAAGATIDGTCGMHVHHDASDLTARGWGRLFRLWANAQDATDTLVAPSRRNTREGRGGRWARRLPDQYVRNAERLVVLHGAATVLPFGDVVGVRGDRYYSLNADPYGRQGTIEVRQHQGTTNAAKVLGWIDYAQALFTYAEGSADLPDEGVTLPALLRALVNAGAIDPVAADWLSLRADAIARRNAAATATAPADDGTRDDGSCNCHECREERVASGRENATAGGEW